MKGKEELESSIATHEGYVGGTIGATVPYLRVLIWDIGQGSQPIRVAYFPATPLKGEIMWPGRP